LVGCAVIEGDQATDLDEEQAALGHVEVGERVLHLPRVEMAGTPGLDLEHGHSGARDALGVEVGGLIAFDDRATDLAGAQGGEGLFEQRGLACSRGADEVERAGVPAVEEAAGQRGMPVVLGEQGLLDLYHTALARGSRRVARLGRVLVPVAVAVMLMVASVRLVMGVSMAHGLSASTCGAHSYTSNARNLISRPPSIPMGQVPHRGQAFIRSTTSLSDPQARQWPRAGSISTSSLAPSQTVPLATAGKQNISASISTPASAPRTTSTLTTWVTPWRVASSTAAFTREQAIESSCIEEVRIRFTPAESGRLWSLCTMVRSPEPGACPACARDG
jgi:hypothetical protein